MKISGDLKDFDNKVEYNAEYLEQREKVEKKMTDPLIQAIGRCNPDEPLEPGDPRWHNFDPIRGTQLHRRLTRRLLAAEADQKIQYSHIALAGHRGCGKSTELARFRDNVLSHGYLPLYAAVNEQADPNDVGLGDLFMLMLRLLDEAFHGDSRLPPLPEKPVAVVTEWFKERTRVEEQELERAITYSGDVVLGPDTPLGKLLFGLNVLRKTTGKRREEVKEAVEKYPYELRQNLNILLDEARKLLFSFYPGGPLFILDNLDRYEPEMIGRVFLRNAELLKGIAAHVIFVVPISLLYEPKGGDLANWYDLETMPMLPIYHRQEPHAPNQAALDEVSQAIFKRADSSLFAGPDLAHEMARLSGGCPRDLLRLLKEALLESEGQIEEWTLGRAANLLRAEMSRKLTLAHFAILARTYLDGAIDSDETGRYLLYYRMALEYLESNGEKWVGVHPLLWDVPEFKAALAAEPEARSGLVTNGD